MADQAPELGTVVVDPSRVAVEPDPDFDPDQSDRTVWLVEFLVSRLKTLSNPLFFFILFRPVNPAGFERLREFSVELDHLASVRQATPARSQGEP